MTARKAARIVWFVACCSAFAALLFLVPADETPGLAAGIVPVVVPR